MVNYAEKYSKQIDQVYTHESFVAPIAAGKYEFTGVATLNVFSPETVPVTDYNPDEGYGAPQRMGNGVQEMYVSQDKKFTLIIDKKDKLSTNGTMEAGARLKQQMAEQVTPTQDKYALAEFVKQAGTVAGVSAPTGEKGVFKALVAARTAMNNALVPEGGRYCFIGSALAANLIESGVLVAILRLQARTTPKAILVAYLALRSSKFPTTICPKAATCFA